MLHSVCDPYTKRSSTAAVALCSKKDKEDKLTVTGMKKKNSQGSLFPPSNIKRKKYTIRRISSLFTYSLISEHSLTHINWTSNFCLHFFPLCFLYCCFSMFVYVQNATTVHPRHTAQFFTHPMKMKLRRGYILAFLKMHNSLHCPLIQYQPIDYVL